MYIFLFCLFIVSKALSLQRTLEKGFKIPKKIVTNFRKPGFHLECFYCENKRSEAECNAENKVITCADNALACEVPISRSR